MLNPLVTNGFTHRYHLDESTFNFRRISSDFSLLIHFSMKIMKANRKAQDGTPRFASHLGTPRFVASHLGLFCSPMSNKKEARLI